MYPGSQSVQLCDANVILAREESTAPFTLSRNKLPTLTLFLLNMASLTCHPHSAEVLPVCLYSEHTELAASELPCLRKYKIFQLPSIPFPFLIVFSDTACAALNSRASVIKGRSLQVDLQCPPEVPWMLPAGWSHYESSRSTTGSREPGTAKKADKPPGRRIKVLLWRLGFVKEKQEGISAQRELTPLRGKGIPLILESTGLAAGMEVEGRRKDYLRTTWGSL